MGSPFAAARLRKGIFMRTFLLIVGLGGALALAACNTVRGVGQDVQSAANATDNAMHGR